MHASIAWHRIDRPGHEIARLERSRDGWRLSGIVELADDGQQCHLKYTIDCDAAWFTRSVTMSGEIRGRPAALQLAPTADGRWRVGDAVREDLRGCIDVDLAFTPFTNTLPIRRLKLPIGQRADVRAAWVKFPSLEVAVLEQSYTRTGERTFRYESNDGAFQRLLTVDANGLVTDYPDFWRARTRDPRE